jgi:hypothetical protein
MVTPSVSEELFVPRLRAVDSMVTPSVSEELFVPRLRVGLPSLGTKHDGGASCNLAYFSATAIRAGR